MAVPSGNCSSLATEIARRRLAARIGRVKIAPNQMFWLAGHAARKHPANGVLHPLWAKALAIEDRCGQTLFIVAADLIGNNFGRQMSETIAEAVARRTGLAGKRIVIDFSHTHCGPVTGVCDEALVNYGLDEQQQTGLKAYTKRLEAKLAELTLSSRFRGCSRLLQPSAKEKRRSLLTGASGTSRMGRSILRCRC